MPISRTPLDDVHGQGVDDAERGDQHGDRGQRIEQAEDPASASSMAPSIRSSGTTSSASWEAAVRSASRAESGVPGANRSANTSAPATPRLVVASSQPTSIDSPVRPGIDRSTMPTTCRSRRRAVDRRHRQDLVDGQAEAGGQPGRDDRRTAGVERGERRIAVAVDEASRPSAAMSAPTTAAASVRTPSRATSKVAIGLTRATPGRAGQVLGDALVLGDRADRGQDELARDDVGDPAGGRGAGVLPDPAERDDHRQPDRQAAEGQRGPAPVADDGAAGEPLLERKQAANGARRPGDGGRTNGISSVATSRIA
jgi:hypothetical protein